MKKSKVWDSLETNAIFVAIILICIATVIKWAVGRMDPDMAKQIEEGIKWVYAYVASLGLGWCAKNDRFMAVDVLPKLYPKTLQQMIRKLSMGILFLLSLVMAGASTVKLISVFTSGEQNQALGCPMAILYAATVLGFVLMAIRLVERMVRRETE